MKGRMLDLLVCPSCKGALDLRDPVTQDGEIREGVLFCDDCEAPYEVRDFVPRFVKGDSYAGNFSFEWDVHARTQLDGETSTESEQTFQEKTGFREQDLSGSVILDVGVGSGRFADVVERQGAEVVGVDLSYAVESARENIGRRAGVHLVQADVFSLPFRPCSFDFVYSIGVLHHTPDCHGAFKCAAEMVKPGGSLAVWLYSGYADNEKVNAVYRAITARMPKRLLYALCYLSVPMYYIYKLPLAKGVLDHLIPRFSVHPNWRWRVLDTFDWFSPRYQSKHRYPEVAGWFREAGFRNLKMLEPPVAVSGVRTCHLPQSERPLRCNDV
jgi:SAM-dependent methyltransferase